MSPRGTIERLLEIHEVDSKDEHSEDELDAMAMVLLADLCSDLAIALAGADGRSAHRHLARERAAEQADAIRSVLAVWQMAGVEIVDGPFFAESPLGSLMRD